MLRSTSVNTKKRNSISFYPAYTSKLEFGNEQFSIRAPNNYATIVYCYDFCARMFLVKFY